MTGYPPQLGVVLLLAFLLQIVLVTVTVLHFNTSLNQLKETFSRSSVSCLKGWDPQRLSAVPDDPCWQVTQQLHQLIEKSSQRYQKQISSVVRDEVSRVLPSLVPGDDGAPLRPQVAAHVTGSFAPRVEGGAVSTGAMAADGRRLPGQKILWWEGQKGLAFLQDMQLADGELVVPRPGLYYVYGQTYFRHTRSLDNDDDRGKPLLQYIYKKMSTYPVPILLMKTSRTSCWSRDSEYSLYSAHQGGVFFLNSGDRLFVTVTNASAVDMDEQSSFFGAFLIS
ncbi:tumor necrosis factor ligand superfamily member 10 [Festucalex cinctus]